MVNKNQVIDEPLEDASGFNVVKLIGVGSLSFLAAAFFFSTFAMVLSINPISYFTKPYVEAGSTCSLLKNESKYISSGQLDNFIFVEQAALKLAQIKGCLDLLSYPIESDEYQTLLKNVNVIKKLNPEDLLPLEYQKIIDFNLSNIALGKGARSFETKDERWLSFLLFWGGSNLIYLFSFMLIKHTGILEVDD